jgi:hypothetical protein
MILTVKICDKKATRNRLKQIICVHRAVLHSPVLLFHFYPNI